jgi:uncharacterized NAD-dependent epimerase/dehydratase family protein
MPVSPVLHISNAVPSAQNDASKKIVELPLPDRKSESPSTAIVYCEANFGAVDGKTANGLVRHSERYKILSVIDSEHAGRDAGEVLDGKASGIPVLRDLAASLATADTPPDYFIFGMAPSSGMLSIHERSIVIEAMNNGLNIVNGLHEFLSEDPIFKAASEANNVTIFDVRKPREKKHLHMFTGKVAELPCRRIAVLGTDCAIGKRTTATILTRVLNERGINAVMVATGQTGLIQGTRYGIPLDATPSQFCAGELEAAMLEAYENERPDVIVVEGQGALSHPAFSSSAFILRGACPDAVILQHAPKRTHRCDFDNMVMPKPAAEINLIQTFSDTKVIGLTLNHEDMSTSEIEYSIAHFEHELMMPVTDPLSGSRARLAEMAFIAFPELLEISLAAA